MKQEAEANAETDRKAKEEVDKLNAADSLIFQTEKQIKDYGDKLTGTNKENIEAALTKLKDAHAAKDFDAMDAAQTELTNAWNAASEELYKATQEAGAPAGEAGPEAPAGDNVQDVNFEEVK